MIRLIREFMCWLDMGHFPRRKPAIVGTPPRWVTNLRCKCGALDVTVDGVLPEHPRRI